MTDAPAPIAERFVQDPASYAWTFGGYDPIRRVKPGEVLDLFVEDCFAGRIRSTADLPSKSIEFPFINPQTGPFYVEGAEPGDTIAVHLIDVRPARDWAVSAHVLFFGSLTGTRYTALLQEALPEKVWLYRVDAAANELTFDARNRTSRCACRWSRSTARSAWRRPPSRSATCSCPRRSGATWTRPM